MAASKLLTRVRALPGGVIALGGFVAAMLVACNAVIGLNDFEKGEGVDAGQPDVVVIDAPFDRPDPPDARPDNDVPVIELPDGALSPTLTRWEMDASVFALGTIGSADAGADAAFEGGAIGVVQQTVRTSKTETRALTWALEESTTAITSFEAAKAHCSKLGGSFRLPSRIELITLLNMDKNASPDFRIGSPLFGVVNRGAYWTASPKRPATEPAQFWTVTFGAANDPVVGSVDESGGAGAYVRCVASNVEAKAGVTQFDEFLRTSNLIYDRFSRLLWERKAVSVANQAAAVSYCTNGHLIDGQGQWRMPKLKELLTTVVEQPARVYVNGTEENRFVDLSAFPGTQGGAFFTDEKSAGSSFTVNYENGDTALLGSGTAGFVRCVQNY